MPGGWPWGTFAVNMIGALLLGYFFARLSDHPEDSLAHPFLTTGICGTLTTFSTLQLELFEMVDGGHLGLAAAYLGATLARRLPLRPRRDRARAPAARWRRVSAAGWVAVGLLGGAAAAARFLIDSAFAARSDHPFPLGVLAINLAGTLVLGLVAGAALEGEALVDRRRWRHRLLHHLLHLDARLAPPRRGRSHTPRLAQPRPLPGRRLRRDRRSATGSAASSELVRTASPHYLLQSVEKV